MKKRILAALLALCMLLPMAACGSASEAKPASDSGPVSENAGGAEEKGAAAVTEPLTITLWHTRGAGANGTEMDRVVKEFNETNEYGITVEAEYIGGYSTIMPKALTSIASGNNPVLIMSSAQNMTTLMSKGVLADMTAYIERDSFDMSVFPQALMKYSYYDDEIVTLPYLVSTCIFVYNRALFDKAGVDVPTTVDELVAAGEAIYAKTGVQAFGMPIDPTYMQDALLHSLSGVGIIDEDGVTTSCLTNGSFVQLADDWRSWIEAGWCKAPNITSTNTDLLEAFYQGKLASFLVSSGSLQNIVDQCSGTIDLDVAYMPGYNGCATNIGGANIAIIQKNHTDQEVAAAWEFLKFLMSDEQLAQNAVNTGYLPVTTTAAATQTIADYWEALPQAKIGYDQLAWADVCAFSLYTSEWYDQMTSALSYVVQARNMTGAEAAEYLQKQYNSIFE